MRRLTRRLWRRWLLVIPLIAACMAVVVFLLVGWLGDGSFGAFYDIDYLIPLPSHCLRVFVWSYLSTVVAESIVLLGFVVAGAPLAQRRFFDLKRLGARLWDKRCAVSLAVLVVYIAAYVALSLTGGYVFTQSGDVRYSPIGLSVSDIVQWQPRFGFCQLFREIKGTRTLRADSLGYLFSPLILLDQALIHRTVRLFDPRTGEPIEHPHENRF